MSVDPFPACSYQLSILLLKQCTVFIMGEWRTKVEKTK
jgi:hypothetical protein